MKVSSSNPTFGLNEGLIAHYPFDGDFKDYSGNGNHLTINGNLTFANAKISQGVYNSGTSISDYLSISAANASAFNLQNWSVAFWTKTNKENLSNNSYTLRNATEVTRYKGTDTGTHLRVNASEGAGLIAEWLFDNLTYGTVQISLTGYLSSSRAGAGRYEIIDEATQEIISSGNFQNITTSGSLFSAGYLPRNSQIRVKIYSNALVDLYFTISTCARGGYEGIIGKQSVFEVMFAGTAVRIYIYHDGTSNNYYLNNSTRTISNMEHYVITYDNSNLICYKNGALVSTTSAPFTVTSASSDVRVGRSWNFNGIPYGWYDDLRVYNRAISQAEVTSIYNLGTGIQSNYFTAYSHPTLSATSFKSQAVTSSHKGKIAAASTVNKISTSTNKTYIARST